jgi:hypothetical protein
VARVSVLAVLLVSASTCAVRSSHTVEPVKVYTFPAALPDRSLVCVETMFDADPPCITLGRLRRMVRETGAD